MYSAGKINPFPVTLRSRAMNVFARQASQSGDVVSICMDQDDQPELNDLITQLKVSHRIKTVIIYVVDNPVSFARESDDRTILPWPSWEDRAADWPFIFEEAYRRAHTSSCIPKPLLNYKHNPALKGHLDAFPFTGVAHVLRVFQRALDTYVRDGIPHECLTPELLVGSTPRLPAIQANTAA